MIYMQNILRRNADAKIYFSKNYNKGQDFTRMCIGGGRVCPLWTKGVQCNNKDFGYRKKRQARSRMTFIIIMKAKRMRWQIFFHEIAAGCERNVFPEKGSTGSSMAMEGSNACM